MRYYDIKGPRTTSGDDMIEPDHTMGYNKLVVLFGGILLFYFFMRKEKRIKSGIGLINFTISPHNEKIAIGLAIAALGFYGLDIYLKHKNPQK